MSSDHPFDDKLKQSLEGFEPNVHANWAEFSRSLDEAEGAVNSGTSGRHMSRWAVAAAVAAGGALMWVAKPVVERVFAPVNMESSPMMGETNPSFDEAWDEFTNVTEGFVQDVIDADAAAALLEESQNAKSVTPPTSVLSTSASASLDEPKVTFTSNSARDNDFEEGVAPENDQARMVRLLAELPFDASVREACEGVEVAFELSGLDRNMSFLWNFGDGHFSSDPSPSHVFDRPGTYDITLSVRPPGEGSISTRTIQNMITVLPKPKACFAWAFPSTVKGDRVRVQLRDQTPDATSVQWVVDGEASQKGLFQLEVPGVYPVNLVASNRHGCLDEAHHDIHVGDRHGLLAQARFSPNGDGRYDTFMPHGLKDMQQDWEMVIVNKQGQEVYRTSDANAPWDGSLPNGEVASDRATYTWTVRCLDAQGTARLFTDRLRIER